MGGQALIGLWPRIADSYLQYLLVDALGEIRHRVAVPFLIERLSEADDFWSSQELKKDWWSDDSPLGKERRDRYGKTLYPVRSLGKIGDPRARDVIERVKKRWGSFQYGISQITEACDAALKKLDRR